MTRIGIIGGSGLYKIEGVENIKEAAVKTPFGEPSDQGHTLFTKLSWVF